jgi:glycosyltransferase involved in cell wall biosynthesis
VRGLWRRLGQFHGYARNYGYSNAAIFALYRLLPRKFVLLAEKVTPTSAPQWLDLAAINYESAVRGVLDYNDWMGYGGAATSVPSTGPSRTFIWFVPDWSNVWGGGHYTLFRFANHFASLGAHNIIYIYNNERHSNPDQLQSELNSALPNCQLEVVVDPKLLPECSGAIATTWQSAYHVRSFPFSRKKFYFMQDYESQFYAHGTASMQANASYTFGFVGMTGGGWLKSRYEAHGGIAQNYRFAADPKIFYPSVNGAPVRDKVKRVFFYGRPSTERRCFELGIASLSALAKKYPDVEIVIAGLDLKGHPPFPATLLGNMSLAATGDLYRTCDIGIAFSGTNLSYLPVELMASGVPVISNNGPQVEWHCKHLENSYLCDPTPAAVLEAFDRLYIDKGLRQQLALGGVNTMSALSWESEMTKAFQYFTSFLDW